jgi:DNA-directed RNA polymerase subunit RPC12/RpoP
MNLPEALMAGMFILLFLYVGTGLFLHYNRNAQLKKRLLPYLIIGPAILVAIFAVIVTRRPSMAIFFVIPAGFFYWFQVQTTTFCNACGRTISAFHGNIAFSKPIHCSECGAKLKT